jgi:hypothetical protein
MRTTFLLPILALAFASPSVPLTAADSSASSTPSSAKASLNGDFKGRWKGQDESSGDLRITFAPGTDSSLTARAIFTYEGTDVPTQTKELKIDGGRIELAFSWQVQGVTATSRLKGDIKGDKLEGTYESSTAEGAATGSWSVSKVQAGS